MEEPVLGCLGVISHVVGVLDLSSNGVNIGRGEFVTLLLLIQRGSRCSGRASSSTRTMMRGQGQGWGPFHCKWECNWHGADVLILEQ